MNKNKLVLAWSSWIAQLIAIGGHIFTSPVTSRPVEYPYAYISYAIVGFWMLVSFYGTVAGAYSIVGGLKSRSPATVVHGLVGFGIGAFLIVSAYL